MEDNTNFNRVNNSMMPQPMAEGRNKLVLPLAATIVVALGAMAFAFYSFTSASQKSSEIVSLKGEINELKEPTTNVETSENKKEVVKTFNFEIKNLVIDQDKCLGEGCGNENTVYGRNWGGANICGIDVSGDGTSSIGLTVSYEEAKNCYGRGQEIIGDGYKNYKISTNKPIVDFGVYGFGQAVGYETVFVSFEDGTVGYLPLAHALKNQKFELYGMVPKVEKIISLVKSYVSECIENCGTEEAASSSGMTVLAQRYDGYFYDLYAFVNGEAKQYYSIY